MLTSADRARRGVIHVSIHAPALSESADGVAPQHCVQGLATQAVRLLSGWALAQLALRRLEICATAGGVSGLASRRVAEGSFIYVGMRRSRVPATGLEYADPLYVREPEG